MRGREAFAGRMGIWLRQFGDTAERTLPAILATLRDFGGYDALMLKVADGMWWQASNDPLTPVRSIADVLTVQEACRASGVAFVPVAVPLQWGPDSERWARHGPPPSLAQQAEFHASIAGAVGCLLVDLEPYEWFIEVNHDQIPIYANNLRVNAPHAYLVTQPDPRAWARAASRVDQTAGDFDGICAQHYVGWTAGGVNWTDVDREVASFRSLAALGRDMYVTLYGVDQTDLAGALWERVRDEALGAHVFSMGPMNAIQLRYFGGLPRAAPPEPEPEPPEPPAPPDDLAGALGAIAAGLDDLSMRAAVQAAAVREYGAKHA